MVGKQIEEIFIQNYFIDLFQKHFKKTQIIKKRTKKQTFLYLNWCICNWGELEMTTLLPNAQACSQVEAYEDMFKEITRKLYGEVSSETSQNLHTPSSSAASHITPAVPDVERTFTNLVM